MIYSHQVFFTDLGDKTPFYKFEQAVGVFENRSINLNLSYNRHDTIITHLETKRIWASES